VAADGITPVITDQRSVSRPQGTDCDIGAFELTSSAALLTITKYQSTGFALGQQGASYTITVSNAVTAGPTSGTVMVSDPLPSGLTLVSMSGTGRSCTNTTCTRSDVLAASDSYPPITVIVNVAANAISPVVNTATVSGGGSATASASASTIIAGAPVLSIAKTHTGSFALGQQGAAYTLTVSNAAGAGPTSGMVSVTDTTPAGLSFVSMAGSGWSCVSNTCTRTVSLLAGLDLHTGKVTEIVNNTHKSSDFIEFLTKLDAAYPATQTLRLILDNHSAHISRETQRYLATRPQRFHFVFIPKHGSWLNLVENLFSKMTRTMLREIRVKTKQELVHGELPNWPGCSGFFLRCRLVLIPWPRCATSLSCSFM
jgi:uncharacterized repeat protein (TIGR01451 family)